MTRKLSSFVKQRNKLELKPKWGNISGGHAQLFFESSIAIPQLEGSISAIAIPQRLKKWCSATAIPQSQFLGGPQLKSFASAIFSAFLAVKSGRFMKKKIGGKKSCATVPLRQVFGFQRNRQF